MGTVGVNISAPANPQMASATRKGRLGMPVLAASVGGIGFGWMRRLLRE
jgi:hypothetical protein